jgi:hypothetical protein
MYILDTNQISRLSTLSRQELFDLWRKTFGKTPPTGFRREILIPFLAYKLQENAYGGLKPEIRAELRRVARSLENGTTSRGRLIRHRLKSGTRIYRRWRSEMHEVFVTNSGFEHRGLTYQSLSELARRITGTRWSGPAFFGLHKKNRPIERSDA